MDTLRKLFEKNKTVKSLEKTLSKVLECIQKITSTTIANLDLQDKEKHLVKTFDEDFTNLAKVVATQVQKNHDASLFNTVCTNIHIDLNKIDGKIKELRKCIAKGKKLYR